MNQITHKLSKTELLSLAALILVSIIIWIAGPSLLIANTYPLAGPEKRFGVIMVLFLGWLLLSLVYSTPLPAENSTPAALPETQKKLQALQGRFHGAMSFFKKTIINKQGLHINLSHLPWYLLIGPKNSGKTTLLANSHVNFILSKQFKQENIQSISTSEACDWWATRDLVLVDVPGTYIHSQDKTKRNSPRGSLQNVLWYNLLNLIDSHRKNETLNGMIIALNLPELMNQQTSQKKATVLDIKHRITELREKFGKELPCYFIITKCDLLPGFLEFFSDSSTDELAQMWGVTVPALRAGDKLSEVLVHRFNALIKRLNKQLIWRLHKERNSNARSLIKDFPLHIERVKENMAQFIKALGIPDLCLNGIFFTSAIQVTQEAPSNNTSITINASNHTALQILQPTALPSKPYFIRQVLTQALFHTPEHQVRRPTTPTPNWHRLAAYAASISIIAIATLFLGFDFRRGMQQAYSIQNDLAQYQMHMQQDTLEGERLINALPLLNTLQSASDNTEAKLTRLANHFAFYTHKSQQTADQVYAKALETIVKPAIKKDLEKYLQNSNEKNSAQLYAALKAYLMLSDTSHLEPEFITKTIQRILPHTTKKQAIEQLNQHIIAALSIKQEPQTLDNNLISNARKHLVNLPSTDLAYVILKNMYDNNLDSPIKLGTDNKNTTVFVSNQLANQIPNMFTANGFKAIQSGEISIAANEATQGNWVLGNINSPQQTNANIVEQLNSRYLTNYIDIWESQLANIKLYTPKNITELNIMLTTLTSNNSPLLQMLHTIQSNTEFDSITSTSPKLQALNGLLANASNNQNNFLYQMFVSLKELNGYVNRMANTNDVGAAAFQAAKQHIQKSQQDPITNINTLAQQMPDPMKTWLTTMSTQTWSLISQTAAHYIDIAWQKNIMSIYRSQIAERFPFSRKAESEVNIQTFSNFLGQQGLLTSFYQSYLKPFVDDSQQNEWHWRTVDNQALPFKNEILSQLQNAAKIQRAFFPNGDNQLFVQFTLQPVSIEPNTKSINIVINGQQFDYAKNQATTPKVFSWPGNNSNAHTTSVNFVTPDNQLITDAAKGDWGWFRLVEKATTSVNTRKEIMLTFDVKGQSAKYLLFTQGHLNPFLPMNLEQMQLPDTLV